MKEDSSQPIPPRGTCLHKLFVKQRQSHITNHHIILMLLVLLVFASVAWSGGLQGILKDSLVINKNIPALSTALSQEGTNFFAQDPPGLDSATLKPSSPSIWAHDVSLNTSRSRTEFEHQHPQLAFIKGQKTGGTTVVGVYHIFVIYLVF
jgi:hypothetical protein